MRVNTEKIKKEIKRKGWSITHFADECGISRQAVYDIYKNQRTSLRILSEIGKALDYDPKDLLH